MTVLPSPGLTIPMRRVMRLGTVVSALLLPLAAGTGWLLGGSEAAWGTFLGLAVPVLFFSVTVATALLTARMETTGLGAVVLGSWLAKIVALLAVLAVLDGADFYSRGAFFGAFLVGVVAYLALEGWVVARARVPYVEPSRQGPEAPL